MPFFLFTQDKSTSERQRSLVRWASDVTAHGSKVGCYKYLLFTSPGDEATNATCRACLFGWCGTYSMVVLAMKTAVSDQKRISVQTRSLLEWFVQDASLC